MDFFEFLRKQPIILAPMSGVTDFPFRSLVSSMGNSLVVSEMLACKAVVRRNKKTIKRSELVGENTSVQLIGNDPEDMSESAKFCEDIGARIIDLNFGCPVKKVINGYAGSALMKDEIHAAKIISSVVAAVKLPVTLKMRTGWDAEHRNAPNLARIAEAEGVKMVTVHGRTRAQMYSGIADWSFIENVKIAVKIPVVVNGDVICYETAQEALTQSKADGVMVGRGALGKPWIIEQLSRFLTTGEVSSEPPVELKREIALRHYDATVDYYGERVGLSSAKKHVHWYVKGMHSASDMRVKIFNTQSVLEVRNIIDEFFQKAIDAAYM